MLLTFSTLAFAILLTAAMLDLLPRRVRRGLYFGVTTGADFAASEGGRKLSREYRAWVWLGAVLALALLLAALSVPLPSLVPVALLLPAPVALTGWVRAWREAKRHAIGASVRRTAPLGPDHLPVRHPALAFSLSAAVLISAGAILLRSYDSLPERLPMHYGVSGNPDAFMSKSTISVLAPLGIGFVTVALLALYAAGIAFGSRRGGSDEIRTFRLAHRSFAIRFLSGMALLISLLFAYLACIPLVGTSLPGGPWGLLLAVGVLLGYSLWSVFRWRELPSGAGDDTPDSAWKWGLLYFNPDDPAWMVERRDNVGFTPNFGRPFAWAIVAMVALLMAAPQVLMR